MVQLSILSGKMAGTSWVARRFPVHIGRSAGSDIQVEDAGVWDEHLKIDFVPGEGFMVSTQPDALAAVNSQSVNEAILRNGDIIEAGSLKMQFWLSETRQRGLRIRESLTWIAIAGICIGQVALIYLLIR